MHIKDVEISPQSIISNTAAKQTEPEVVDDAEMSDQTYVFER